jgi:homoserine dehydrogenase
LSRKRGIGVGLIGFGTIGTGVVRILREHSRELGARLGEPLRLAAIADLDTKTDRGVKLAAGVLGNDARALIHREDVDVVVELMGGVEPARTFHEEALRAGKAVVSANKALVSVHGPALARIAERKGVAYGFEAAVGGGIPIIRTLKESLVGDRNQEIFGIVNGTANYILSEMAAGGGEFDEVLARAQAMGLAEADPTYDVDGIDSLHKLVVLVALAFGRRLRPSAVNVEGIRHISGIDMAYAREFGYTLKLLAVAKPVGDAVEASVHPAMVPNSHLLSQVGGAFNAICVQGRALGSSIYYGQGAGMMPTATAVVGDIMEAALAIRSGGKPVLPPYGYAVSELRPARVLPMADATGEHYLRLHVKDRPGVLAKITAALGRAGVSIAAVMQPEGPVRGNVAIVMRTHLTTERALRGALAKIAKMPEVKAKPVAIRVEEALGSDHV